MINIVGFEKIKSSKLREHGKILYVQQYFSARRLPPLNIMTPFNKCSYNATSLGKYDSNQFGVTKIPFGLSFNDIIFSRPDNVFQVGVEQLLRMTVQTPQVAARATPTAWSQSLACQ